MPQYHATLVLRLLIAIIVVIQQTPTIPINQAADVGEFETKCPKCGKNYKVYVKFVDNPKIDKDYQTKGSIPFPKNGKITCDCGSEIDLQGIKNNLELQVGKKIIV